ncbi:MAG TPA: glycosyltransferase family 2 protein [Thermoanaerobaculia bacterium]|nr:glycosyltransferase family 2 protein [Thermoanaerobaculia bacterium]
MTAAPLVSVAVVTHDSAADLPACFDALAALVHRPLELVLADCASGDGSAALAERLARGLPFPATTVALAENLGFAGGMNAALAVCGGEWVLSLNPDAAPEPSYLERLLAAASRRGPVGAVTGRLVRPATAGGERWLDACGMRLRPTWRHLDRGSGEPDRGQLARPARVFGATGAASLWRRAALDDVAIEGEVFDPRFHSYREDAELCFRLRERGWEILYEPSAVAVHRRHNLPGRRRAMDAAINCHSLKNRYLLRLYHQTPLNLATTLLPALWRDAVALAYVLGFERSSRAAYAWLWRHRRELWRRRRAIQARRTVASRELERWFWREADDP